MYIVSLCLYVYCVLYYITVLTLTARILNYLSFTFYLLQETDVDIVLFNVLETPKDTMKHVLCAWILVAGFLHVKCNQFY